MAVRYELCIGLNKGHKTTKIKNVKYTGNKKAKGLRGARLKNVSIFLRLILKHVKFVEDINIIVHCFDVYFNDDHLNHSQTTV